jgi:peptide/nickel transport system substrate-binding protein
MRRTVALPTAAEARPKPAQAELVEARALRQAQGERFRIILSAVLMLSLLVVACGPAGPRTSESGAPAGEPARSGPPKRVTAAIQSDPGSLNGHVNPPGSGVPGLDVVETLVSAGLSISDSESRLVPLLAEAVPTVDNGLWKVLPEGRMETTWHIRPNAQWQDGTPFTASDLVFTAQVEQDKTIDTLPKPAYDSVESIAAPDPRTLVVTWKRPFIGADQTFNTPPLPRHILERPYLEDKATFGTLPYWTQDMMSTGAYRVRQFVGGSHVLLAASDRYVLGRPKIDEIEVRFIPDGNTLSANLLAGAVDVTLGRSLSLDEALQVRDRWPDGKMDLAFAGWLVVFPQFMNPSPAAVANLQFRRALLHAIDRGQMAETLMGGTVPVAHTFLSPSDPAYGSIEPEIVRYDYDTRRAAELLEGMGFVRGADGYRDAAGQRLAVEIRVSSGRDLNMKTIFAIADYWQRLGLAAEPLVMPQQRARDREYVQTFPGFILYNQPNDINSLNRHLSSQTPLSENNYVGNNNSRYVSPEFDSLIERFFATIPTAERTRALGQVVRHMTENLNMMGQFYNAEPALIADRLVNVVGRRGGDAFPTWNVQDWDVR